MAVKVSRNGHAGGRMTGIGPEPTNGAEADIATDQPYTVRALIRGTADLLLHRWNVEAVAEKSAAKKGSTAKKSDNIESYVYRDPKGFICLPGEYLRGAIIGASKFRQDPRSPRKSAMDLFKAAIAPLTDLAPILVNGQPTETWDYEDARRVTVQRSGITRIRPAFHKGWTAQIDLMVLIPGYVTFDLLHEVLVDAGRLIGVGDFRPTYGRFAVASFERLTEE